MSAISRLKGEIRQKQHTRGSFNAFRDLYQPDNKNLTILPKKPRTKEPLLVVNKESKRSLRRTSKASSSHQTGQGKLREEDSTVFGDEDTDEEEDAKEATVRRIPWGPKEILEHLDNPQIVGNVEAVIASLNGPDEEKEERDKKGKKQKVREIVVWDHGKTSDGQKSDNNFFLWLESYAALKCDEKKEEENAAFR